MLSKYFYCILLKTQKPSYKVTQIVPFTLCRRSETRASSYDSKKFSTFASIRLFIFTTDKAPEKYIQKQAENIFDA